MRSASARSCPPRARTVVAANACKSWSGSGSSVGTAEHDAQLEARGALLEREHAAPGRREQRRRGLVGRAQREELRQRPAPLPEEPEFFAPLQPFIRDLASMSGGEYESI